MLIAISGSQGCGKTSTISGLRQRGYGTVERKAARSILDEWGVTLADVNHDLDLTLQYQEALLERKIADDTIGAQSDGVIFTERSLADLFVYALITLGKENQYSKWLNNYHDRCSRHQSLYDQVIYIKAGHFLPVHDGVRGSNVHYSTMVDLVMYDFTKGMTALTKFKVLDASCLDHRVNCIMHMVDKIKTTKGTT